MVHETGIDGIETQFNVKINRNNLKFPKIKFKGTPTASVIRKESNQPAPGKIDEDILKHLPNPYEKNNVNQTDHKKGEKISADDSFITPSYEIVHSFAMDIQEFQESSDVLTEIPNSLIVTVYLPKLNSATGIDLKVFERCLTLTSTSPTKYKLEVALPYAVFEEDGTAKFDTTKQCLKIQLPVHRENSDKFTHLADPVTNTELIQGEE